MKMYDLSVLIPARNEMFLSKTVETILKNIRGNTEIIVVLDGEWANPGIPEDPRVTIIYHNKSIGQRAATNEACQLSNAKYVMKIDAHCIVDEGFDVKMMQEMHDDYTMIPTMYNLHAFDWVCVGDNNVAADPYIDEPARQLGCGHSIYQGPTPAKCEKCGGKMVRELVWKHRQSRKSNYYRFDKTLHFQYWGEYGNRPQAQGDVVEIMSAQGSCFMLTREKYWQLDICDERAGSWGQQGVEVACKTWLSGGKLMTNKKTWYAHMFRTQGGDFSFPYPLSGKDVEKARKYSRELWMEGKWDKAIEGRNLRWLLNKFSPVPDWHDNVPKEEKPTSTQVDKPKKPSKQVVYYTHSEGNDQILEACRKQLKKGMKEKHIISVSAVPLQFGSNIVLPRIKISGFLDMFQRIYLGLEASTADVIFFCEHDVLYHPSHFDFIPPDKNKYYYNTNVWRVRYSDGHALWVDGLQQLSGLVAWRETLLEHYKKRIKKIVESGFSFDMGFEPGTHGRESRVDDLKADSYMAKFPNIDIRHDTNATASRWKKEEFRNQRYTQGWKEAQEVPGWGKTFNNMPQLLDSILAS